LGQSGEELNFEGNKRLLDGLARELKLSLTFIAKQAEFQSEKSDFDLGKIEKSASDSLRLIDNYLLCARTEYGQQMLPMEPVGPGSILYEASQYFLPTSQDYAGEITIQTGYNKPVMANKPALVAAIYSLAKIVINSSAKKDAGQLFFVSQKKRRGGLFIGVFAHGFSAKPSEIKRSAELLGSSGMSLSNQTFASGVDLTIAGQLAASMGARLFSTKYKGKGGIALELIKSNQLSLVRR
jgi:hypothetical protein